VRPLEAELPVPATLSLPHVTVKLSPYATGYLSAHKYLQRSMARADEYIDNLVATHHKGLSSHSLHEAQADVNLTELGVEQHSNKTTGLQALQDFRMKIFANHMGGQHAVESARPTEGPLAFALRALHDKALKRSQQARSQPRDEEKEADETEALARQDVESSRTLRRARLFGS